MISGSIGVGGGVKVVGGDVEVGRLCDEEACRLWLRGDGVKDVKVLLEVGKSERLSDRSLDCGEMLIWLLSGGISTNIDESARSNGFWRLAASSSRKLVGGTCAGKDPLLVRLGETGMFEDPRGGLQNDMQ